MISNKGTSYATVLLHLCCWLLFAFALLFYQPLSWNITVPAQFWVKQVSVLLFLMIVFYGNTFFLVPNLLLKNKNLAFILVILVVALLSGPIFKSIDKALGLPELMARAFDRHSNQKSPMRDNYIDLFLLMMTLFIAGISTSVTLIEKWQSDRQTRTLLEKEKIGTELSFLKAQINPHFFFNTLNNIYALTHIDIEGSRTALHKLSRMMRYLLYETAVGSTALSKEVSFVTDYISLMKLRLNEFTIVNYSEPQLTSDPQVAPMLFLPYIENAFKYGVSTTERTRIDIAFELKGNHFSMTISNSVLTLSMPEDGYSGIGLTNTKRRLELLYPNRHQLETGKTPDGIEFFVHLQLDLS